MVMFESLPFSYWKMYSCHLMKYYSITIMWFKQSLNAKKLLCTLLKLGGNFSLQSCEQQPGLWVRSLPIWMLWNVTLLQCGFSGRTYRGQKDVNDRKKTENWERKSRSNCHKRPAYLSLNLKISQSSHPI